MSTYFHVTCIDCHNTNKDGVNWGGDEINLVAAHWTSIRTAALIAEDAVKIFRSNQLWNDIVRFLLHHEQHQLRVADQYNENQLSLKLDSCTGCSFCLPQNSIRKK